MLGDTWLLSLDQMGTPQTFGSDQRRPLGVTAVALSSILNTNSYVCSILGAWSPEGSLSRLLQHGTNGGSALIGHSSKQAKGILGLFGG